MPQVQCRADVGWVCRPEASSLIFAFSASALESLCIGTTIFLSFLAPKCCTPLTSQPFPVLGEGGKSYLDRVACGSHSLGSLPTSIFPPKHLHGAYNVDGKSGYRVQSSFLTFSRQRAGWRSVGLTSPNRAPPVPFRVHFQVSLVQNQCGPVLLRTVPRIRSPQACGV